MPKLAVWYEGSDTIHNGYLLCYNSDHGTPGDREPSRLNRVEKCKAANVHHFAGVVTGLGGAGRTGPCQLQIARPCGSLTDIHCQESVVLDSTWLYLQIGSYAAGASGPVRIAKAMETEDRSTVAGLVLAKLILPPAERADDQEIGASSSFTDAVWENFPLTDLRRNPQLGTFLEYDPAKHPQAPMPVCAHFDDANANVDVLDGTAIGTCKWLELGQGATAENNAAEVQFPGKIDIDGKPWAFEIAFDLTTVTTDDLPWFLGLHVAETLDGDMLADATQVLKDGGSIGFQVKNDAGAEIDVIYDEAAQAQNDHQAAAGVPVASTTVTLAMHYDGSTITVYVDGTDTEDPILATDIAAVDFPDTRDMYLSIFTKGGGGAEDADDLRVKAFRVAQVA